MKRHTVQLSAMVAFVLLMDLVAGFVPDRNVTSNIRLSQAITAAPLVLFGIWFVAAPSNVRAFYASFHKRSVESPPNPWAVRAIGIAWLLLLAAVIHWGSE